MQHQHYSWFSPALGREMHIEASGHAGARVLVFPTSLGSCYEWGDRHLPEVLADHLDNGWIQLFCFDHVHEESWYDKGMHAGARAWRHLPSDLQTKYGSAQNVPYWQSKKAQEWMGASFGAYQ